MTQAPEVFGRSRVDTVRGLACLLLVSSHMIMGGSEYTGLQSDVITRAENLLVPIRMPLFTFLSGFVYAYSPAVLGRLAEFGLKKVRRLLVPMAVVTALLVAVKSTWGRQPDEVSLGMLPYYLTHHYEHLWFLQASAILFAMFAALDALLPRHRTGTAVALCLLGTGLHFLPVHHISVFSFGDALYLLPFFSLGILLNRWSEPATARGTTIGIALFVLIAAAYTIAMAAPAVERFSPAALVIGLSAPVLLLLWFPATPLLAWLGRYSLTIYLFHVFFAAAANRLVPGDYHLLVAAGVVLSVFGPICIELVLRRYLPGLLPLIGQSGRAGVRASKDAAAIGSPPASRSGIAAE